MFPREQPTGLAITSSICVEGTGRWAWLKGSVRRAQEWQMVGDRGAGFRSHRQDLIKVHSMDTEGFLEDMT